MLILIDLRPKWLGGGNNVLIANPRSAGRMLSALNDLKSALRFQGGARRGAPTAASAAAIPASIIFGTT